MPEGLNPAEIDQSQALEGLEPKATWLFLHPTVTPKQRILQDPVPLIIICARYPNLRCNVPKLSKAPCMRVTTC